MLPKTMTSQAPKVQGPFLAATHCLPCDWYPPRGAYQDLITAFTSEARNAALDNGVLAVY